jgi:hypothetical protein
MFWLVIEQGEEQKKLDVLSNEVFIKALASNGRHRMISPCPLAIVMSASVRRLSQKKNYQFRASIYFFRDLSLRTHVYVRSAFLCPRKQRSWTLPCVESQ